jgi:hypothetical protein
MDIMLWYKSWRESRMRFFLSLGVWAILCMSTIYRAKTGFPPPERPDLPYSAWVWGSIYGNLNPTIFVILAMIFGLGGLQRERPVGTAPFTLSLPVSRTRLITVRALAGLIQIMILALIPALLIPTLSPLIAHQSYAFTQAVQFGLLFFAWGMVAYSVGFLYSSLFGGEFTGTAVCVISPVVYRVFVASSATLQDHPAFNYVTFMSGMPFIQSPVKVLIDKPLPAATLLILGSVAAMFLMCAARITEKLDF